GLNYAVMHFMARARVAKDPGGVRGTARFAIATAAVTSTVVAVALALLAKPVAAQFSGEKADPDQLAHVIRLGAPYVVLFALLQVVRYCTQAYRTMVPSVIAGNIVQPAARFILGVAVVLLGFGVTALVLSEVVSLGIGVALAAWYFRRMMSPAEKTAQPHADRRSIVRFALPQGGASLLGIQSLGLGVLIVAMFEGNREVGLFGIALALQGPGGIFLGGIVNIWAPVVSELHDLGETERLGSLYQTITRWVATFSFPVFAALIVEPGLFLSVFPKDAAAAASVVAILAAGNVFYTGTGPSGFVLSMSGRPGVNFVNSLIGVMLYIGFGLLAVPRYGVVGMAVVDACVTALINTVRVLQVKRYIGVQPFGRSFLKPVGATLIGAALLLLWKFVTPEGFLIELAGVLIAGLAYVFSLRAMGLDAEERYVWERIRARAFKRRSGAKSEK
ncbi:MAG: polysaccharide biosynthesis C-terminal domain-containing protein, partial [Actinobacteria bacterium]|nr:polysaccharide biosynthesis C-terminal domain-containing protein [Actinomycetota bacterium]